MGLGHISFTLWKRHHSANWVVISFTKCTFRTFCRSPFDYTSVAAIFLGTFLLMFLLLLVLTPERCLSPVIQSDYSVVGITCNDAVDRSNKVWALITTSKVLWLPQIECVLVCHLWWFAGPCLRSVSALVARRLVARRSLGIGWMWWFMWQMTNVRFQLLFSCLVIFYGHGWYKSAKSNSCLGLLRF